MSDTVKGIGPGGWQGRQGLAEQQEQQARETAVVYRLYVGVGNGRSSFDIISRYFDGATVYPTTGIWKGEQEYSFVVEIVGTLAQLQAAVSLAGDLRVAFEQSAVLLTWERCNSLLLSEDTIQNGVEDWSGAQDPTDPDNYWIDDATGERINAKTGERSHA